MKLKFDYQSIKNAKQTGRHTTNEKGLQLLIKKGGDKYWVLRYTYGANRHDLTLGSFPEISVADARKKAQEARYQLNQGINPITDRKAKKAALIAQTSSAITFEKFALPLCKRSLEIIGIAKAIDEDSDYLFSRKGKKLSNMAMPMMLRRMSVDVTVHGFRSTFRDWVSEETMHSPEVAEMALAHTII